MSGETERTIDLLILDCDGVLVDSERIAVRVDAEVLAELGWLLTDDEIVERFMGRTHEYMVAEVEAHTGKPFPDVGHRYREAFDAELAAVDGVIDALDRLRVVTCVASSGSHEKMRHTLGLTGLWQRFEGRIFSASEVAAGKPAPDLFLHAARCMGHEPARCAVVEDSHHGVAAALAAGMRVFGYAGGITPRGKLALPGVTVFDDMRDLPGLVSGRGPR